MSEYSECSDYDKRYSPTTDIEQHLLWYNDKEGNFANQFILNSSLMGADEVPHNVVANVLDWNIERSEF